MSEYGTGGYGAGGYGADTIIDSPAAYGAGPYGVGPYGVGFLFSFLATAKARFEAQISWSTFARGVFTLDHSTLDGPDTLTVSAFDPGVIGGGPYDDISALLESLQRDTGRSDNLTEMQAGSGKLVFRDPAGIYNPANPASPLYGLPEDRLHPIRIRAGSTSVAMRPFFFGYTRRIIYTPGRRRNLVEIDLVDFFYWLSRLKPTIAATGVTTVGAVIGLILDAVGFMDPAMRVLGSGETIPTFTADGTQTALDLISSLLEIDRGVFFVNAAGQAVYEDRWQRRVRIVTAAIANAMTAVDPGVDFDTVRNHIEVTRAGGGTLQTVEDPVSVLKVGRSDWTPITSAYLRDDQQASDLANYLVALTKIARPPLYNLQIDSRTDTLLSTILTEDLGAKITAAEASTGSAVTGYIDHLTIDWDRANGRATASYLITKNTEPDPFIIGQSVLDGTDALVF